MQVIMVTEDLVTSTMKTLGNTYLHTILKLQNALIVKF